ncbi:hypothetical protein GCM10010387_16060 [Streptomyces inusitatus]|uniref:Uncharacterized protein n=1 Tax=Streptomyces inusitatus TaxID=68221 RepID=A0A918PUH5_9ACTN|nr:hypothetical protein [Streptomyces inusitatus]GGZ23653.1 hypothetical protein GCM10010387_16060 [Streptomyces inusitatus]
MSLLPTWLRSGSDRALAASSYAGRRSATERAAAKQRTRARTRRQADIREAARAGQAWEEQDRRRFR